MKDLPAGTLNQWIAFDRVEPMGEEWMQTASIVHAINMPIYARSNSELPDVEVFMPPRYRRPRLRKSNALFSAAQTTGKIAGQVKAMFGFGAKK